MTFSPHISFVNLRSEGLHASPLSAETEDRVGSLAYVCGIHETPFGRARIVTFGSHLCSWEFLNQDSSGSQSPAMIPGRLAGTSVKHDSSQTEKFLNTLFHSAAPDVSLMVTGTDFQIRVWKKLTEIPWGKLVCYEDVAKMIDQPRATRAVAAAIASNPVAFLIPCHRVIKKNGDFHQYRWGKALKEKMILMERQGEEKRA